METSATDVEFDVVNLSGSTAAVDLDDLPDDALGRAMRRRVRRDTLEHHAAHVAMFDSTL